MGMSVRGIADEVVLRWFAALAGLFLGLTANAATLSSEPLLRIETAMHTAPLSQISVDSEGRYLLTGAADQTLRLWNLADKRMLRVFRLPGSSSRHQAAALSPNGEWVAAGGMTAGQGSVVYVFSRTTGEIVRDLSGLPSELVSLVWSPDGRFLLLVSHRHGIRVYRTDDWAMVGEDRYSSESWRGDISVDNRVAVSSFDGTLRFYQIEPTRLQRLAAVPSGAAKPVGVSFSPDGRRLAVGFLESPKVSVFDASSFRQLYAASVDGAGNGSLYEVEWGRNDVLYAAGQYRKGGALAALLGAWGAGEARRPTLIRRWRHGGSGRGEDIEAAHDSVNSLAALPDGGVAFGTMDPAWGVVGEDGGREFVQRGLGADFYGLAPGIKLSPDGQVVEFAYEASGESPAYFDVASRTLHDGSSSVALAAAQTARGIKLSTKGGFPRTVFNGRELPLEAGEFDRGRAVAADGSGFVVATDFHLRFYDAQGRETWRQRTPATPRGGVNISQDGRLVVAAYLDGTLRWYRRSDGQPLLALWPHSDRERWVLWSSSGFYDAAPGSEAFLGWQVDRFDESPALPAGEMGAAARGAVNADRTSRVSQHRMLAPAFYSMGRFRDRLYRPDVVGLVLHSLAEDEAVQRADTESGRVEPSATARAMLPPHLTLDSLQELGDGQGRTVALRFRVDVPGGAAATEYFARVNNVPVEIATSRGVKRGQAAKDGLQEITVAVPDEDSEIMLFARNRHGFSEPLAMRVRGVARPQSGKEPRREQPRLFVLAVGVSEYESEVPRLAFAAKDAGDLAARLRSQHGRLYREVEVRSLTDGQVTRGKLIEGLKWLERSVTASDVAILFFAGHGVSDGRGGYYYLASDTNRKNHRETGLSFVDIRTVLARLKGRTLFMVDTCYSGDVLGRKGLDVTYVANDLSSPENGIVVMAASTGRQLSYERKDWGNGAFTKALLEGVEGRADTRGAGEITYKMLDLYVSGRVEQLTEGRQTPFTIVPLGTTDFPVARTR